MFINFLLIVGNLIMKKLKFKKLFFSFFISIFAMGAIAQEKKEIDLFKITKTPLLTWSHIIESRWNTIDNDKNNLLNQSELSSISLAFRFLSFKYFKEFFYFCTVYFSTYSLSDKRTMINQCNP